MRVRRAKLATVWLDTRCAASPPTARPSSKLLSRTIASATGTGGGDDNLMFHQWTMAGGCFVIATAAHVACELAALSRGRLQNAEQEIAYISLSRLLVVTPEVILFVVQLSLSLSFYRFLSRELVVVKSTVSFASFALGLQEKARAEQRQEHTGSDMRTREIITEWSQKPLRREAKKQRAIQRVNEIAPFCRTTPSTGGPPYNQVCMHA